jgi:hypothetical protein
MADAKVKAADCPTGASGEVGALAEGVSGSESACRVVFGKEDAPAGSLRGAKQLERTRGFGAFHIDVVENGAFVEVPNSRRVQQMTDVFDGPVVAAHGGEGDELPLELELPGYLLPSHGCV